MPKVSIILPTYNRASLIGRAIKSVLNQTYGDFELIIVDDGSTDDTEKIVGSFSDKRISYVKHEVNKGAAAARNTGLTIANGELIAFQDSDDEWVFHKLHKQIGIFEKLPSTVGMVYSNINIMTIDGKEILWNPTRYMPYDGNVYHKILPNFRECHMQMGTSLIRRDCFQKVGGFDEKLPRFIDIELYIRISKYFSFYYIDEALVACYGTPDSITTSAIRFVEGEKVILKKYMKDLSKYPNIFADILYEVGHALCLYGNIDSGKTYLLKALKLYPWRLKYLVATCASFFGPNAFNIAVNFKRWLLDS